jgi:hypothetical protein
VTRTEAVFSHVLAMTDDVGIFEHARERQPRIEHGYCVDDVARALIAVCREEPAAAGRSGAQVHGPGVMAGLAEVYLRFLEEAQTADGMVVNRREALGARKGRAVLEDCWGRCLWALGTAASRSRDQSVSRRAVDRFALGAARRSPWPRAMAFAGLGAAEMMRTDPGQPGARALLRDAAAAVGPFSADRAWPWPEPRLTYANAVLPDVLLAAGDALNDHGLVEEGLEMLGWLLEVQSRNGHLSLTPAAGWTTGEPLPAFDQQPIEAATLADACARAFELTGDARWSDAVGLAAEWFFGRNDVGTSLYDAESGGCCDGLEPGGRNENQGAESTLASITTLQHASRLAGTRA